MSVDCKFEMDLPLQPIEALELLVATEETLEWGDASERWADSTYLRSDCLRIWAGQWHESRLQRWEEAFGFRPPFYVLFRFGPDRSKGWRGMIRCIMILLRQGPGDAVLTNDYDHVFLHRRHGELLVDENENPLFLENLVAEIDVPYRVVKLPQPLL